MRLQSASTAQVAAVVVGVLIVVGAGAVVVLHGGGNSQQAVTAGRQSPAGNASTTTPTSTSGGGNESGSSGPATLDACGAIRSSGTYVVGADLSDGSNGRCLSILANDVVVRGGGHSITGGGSGAAVHATGVRNVTVEDLSIDGWSRGVALENVTDGTVAGVSVGGATAGLTVDGGGGGVVVRDSTVRSPGQVGIRVRNADRVGVSNDTVLGSGGVGIHVLDSTNVETIGNLVNDSASHGVLYGLSAGVDTLDQSNVTNWATPPKQAAAANGSAARRTVAAYAPATRNGAVRNNTVRFSGDHGVFVVAARNVTVAGNDLARNNDGIHLSHAAGVTVSGNAVTHNRDDGVQLSFAANDVVAANHVASNGDDGIYVVGNDDRIRNNTVTANGDDGIDVQASTSDHVVGNAVTLNRDDGVLLRNVTRATAHRTVARGNGGFGIDVHRSRHLALTDNEICRNAGGDVSMREARLTDRITNNAC